MPSGTSYIPSTDSQLVAWAENFSDLITAAPSSYGLTAPDAVTIAAAVTAYTGAYETAVNPTTRTKPAVAEKDAQRAAMLATLREYAQQIRRNTGVSNEAKLELGLTVGDVTPTPIPAPTTQPLLAIPVVAINQVILRFADATTPDKRSKPAGVIGLQLVGVQSATVPDGPTGAELFGFVTKQPFTVDVTGRDPSKKLYLWGRWQTRRGLVGPWSDPVSTQIVVG